VPRSRSRPGRIQQAQQGSVRAWRATAQPEKPPWTKAVADKHQNNTEEGFGRLDALNRIGNQVFSTDLAMSGLTGFERNLHAQDAPVSFPPIWTVPWFLYAQYDASIQQPLIRNAGEALGVFLPRSIFHPTFSPKDLFPLVDRARESRSHRRVAARAPDLTGPSFGGLQTAENGRPRFSPTIPYGRSIRRARIQRAAGSMPRSARECHLGPVNDPAFRQAIPGKEFSWSSTQWDAKGRGA